MMAKGEVTLAKARRIKASRRLALRRTGILVALVAEQKDRCYYCNTVMIAHGPFHPTIDHVVPAYEGGIYSDRSNLVAACRRCNQEKGPMSAETFLSVRLNCIEYKKALAEAFRRIELYRAGRKYD